ncbi:DMT family transporter [Actibacterium sp. XHP0104]|uniref:DMT family transporter n=1 Tax=Actibacterium sp. XHP0104 TaxID=2984335 RepID=UPI0021E7BC9C|nr:DMT family transporter [Actibacterium sp. XHP0104]MCV2880919.1 DMT family transporter [Actibacterium sp. XHP0104]
MTGPGTANPASQGIMLMLGAILCFSLMDACAKELSDSLPIPQILWARYAGQTTLVLLFLNRRVPAELRTKRVGLHLLRTAFILIATAMFFTGLAHIGLAEATAIISLNPVFMTLGAALILGETLGRRRLFGIAAALVGALLVIKPGSDVFTAFAILPLIGAVCLSGFALTSRYLGTSESIWTSMLYTGLISSTLLTAIQPFFWVTPSGSVMLLMLALAFSGAIGQFLMISALMRAEASQVAPFIYSGLIFATLWGVLFFGEYPDVLTLTGGLVIILAGIYVWYRETRATS